MLAQLAEVVAATAPSHTRLIVVFGPCDIIMRELEATIHGGTPVQAGFVELKSRFTNQTCILDKMYGFMTLMVRITLQYL